MGRTARAAATFCVVLTLEGALFFAVAFLLAIFGAGFLLFVECLADAAFLVSRTLEELFRAAALEAVARETVALFAFANNRHVGLRERENATSPHLAAARYTPSRATSVSD